jgi:DNA-directed RNA polymerase specialized sigma24 family protein
MAASRYTNATEQYPRISLTDSELMSLARGGDATAFGEFCSRHVSAGWQAAFAVAGDEDDAADAVVEGFAKLLKVGRGRRVEA